jgi:hypothetical protein
MMDRAGTGCRVGQVAGIAIALAVSAVASAEEAGTTARVTPRTAKFGGVSVGMSLAEASWTLEANGFSRSDAAQRRYVDETGDVKKRIRYRELPGPDGTVLIYELDETAWYGSSGFDPARYQAETRQRFGEPTSVAETSVGRTEMVYSEVSAAPTVVEVIGACQAEIQKKSPQLSAEEAEKQASAAAQYGAANDQVEKVCPGAAPSYRKMAESLEAPRMTVVIRSGRVDIMVRWPWVEAELVRRLGREKADRVLVFGVKALDEE